jgi:hypothetical protein
LDNGKDQYNFDDDGDSPFPGCGESYQIREHQDGASNHPQHIRDDGKLGEGQIQGLRARLAINDQGLCDQNDA